MLLVLLDYSVNKKKYNGSVSVHISKLACKCPAENSLSGGDRRTHASMSALGQPTESGNRAGWKTLVEPFFPQQKMPFSSKHFRIPCQFLQWITWGKNRNENFSFWNIFVEEILKFCFGILLSCFRFNFCYILRRGDA